MRRLLGLLLVAAVAVGCSSGSSPATAPSSSGGASHGSVTSTDPAKAAQVMAIVRDGMREMNLRSVIVRVTIDGKEIVTDALGTSMTGVPATTDMNFRTGSVAESLIANLVFQLVDEKQISLDDKIAKWVPHVPHAGEVTIGQLLSSTSGYRDFVPNPKFLKVNDTEPYKTWTPEQILVYSDLDKPLLYAPGTNWNYAHTNWVILGLVLDKINGRPLNEVLQDRVYNPLGLTSTVDPGSPVIPQPVLHAWDSEQRAAYDISPDLPFYADSTGWDTSWSLSKGAIITQDIFDMDTTAIAVGNGKLISPESFKVMTDPAMRNFGGPTPDCPECHRGDDHYAYGMGVVVAGNWLVQDPLVNGYAATEGYLPSQKIAVSVVVTFNPAAFTKEEGAYPNSSNVLFSQIGAQLAPDDPPPAASNNPPPGG